MEKPPRASEGGMTSVRPKPLASVQVLDLSRLLPGAVATLHLADLGAEVVRIEPIGKEPSATLHDGGENPIYSAALSCLALNRNKRVINLDLKQARGRQIFCRLAERADVIVEAFRPGVVDRLGIGYEAIDKLNPRVVYCSISGYGQTGPNRLRAGHDINYIACTGMGDQIGVVEGPPAIPNVQIGDLLGGSLTAVMGILAALLDARTRGRGRYIDVSMSDSILAHSVVALSTMIAAGEPLNRGADALSGGLACYNYYRTLDGRYMAVGALERKFWDRFCEVLERPDLQSKHLVGGEEARKVRLELQDIFSAQNSEYWTEKFRDIDCCVTLLLRLDEAIASPQTRTRKMVVELEGPAGRVTQFAIPLKMSGFEFSVYRSPAPGETHTAEILRGLGYGPEQIEALSSSRIAQ